MFHFFKYMISTFSHAPRLITYMHVLWAQSAAGKTKNGSTYARSQHARNLARRSLTKIMPKAGIPTVTAVWMVLATAGFAMRSNLSFL
jgi:hypothetical protein